MLSFLLLSLVPLVSAHDNGMDMSMDGPMTLAVGQMLPYLHFTPGDMLWFLGWVPQSSGAMVGACIGLFLLGLVERWIAACKVVMYAHWAKRAEIVRANRINAKGLPVTGSLPVLKKQTSITSDVVNQTITFRQAPPFIWSHEITRGIVHAGHVALLYAFMLAVMTYQVGFILSLVVGLGVGEALFGRYALHAQYH